MNEIGKGMDRNSDIASDLGSDIDTVERLQVETRTLIEEADRARLAAIL